MDVTISDVVRLVLGEHREPVWLRSRLLQMTSMVRAYVESEEAAPKRTDMRDRMDEFLGSIAHIKDELADPMFALFLGNDYSEQSDNQVQILSVLERLAERASMQLSRFTGRRGSTRAYPVEENTTISAQELCAWTIMQAMKGSRGIAVVAADNAVAWEAMNCYWRICGGMPLGRKDRPDQEGRPPSGWRAHILAVRDIETSGDRRAAWFTSLAATFQAVSLAG
jgi:hypothetical protein